MFQRIAEGLAGFFIFVAQWIFPAANSEDVKIIAAEEFSYGYRVQYAFNIEWNDQMSDLIDAGIPLRFQIGASSNAGDSISFVRTLQCDIVSYTYTYSDTSLIPQTDSVFVSEKYTQIYRVVRNFCRITCVFSTRAEKLHLDIRLLPSLVSQLNRKIDMSDVCNCGKYTFDMVKKDLKK